MSNLIFFLVLLFSLLLVAPVSLSSLIITSLSKGSSLSTTQDTVISSPNGDYAAGFHAVGNNAYNFAIWFTNPFDDKSHTIVWMANRDQPVNGRHSQLSLLKSGNLVLTDAGQSTVWATETQSNSSHVELNLLNNGNLVLRDYSQGKNIWQSFDTPTDTLLPGQPLTKNSKLVSQRSSTNYSSGFYKLHFSDDNVLELLYEGLEMSSVYWPSPWLKSWEADRSTYNNSKIAVLDTLGLFKSTDNFRFNTSDYGAGIKRRLTLDIDGNLRVYSLNYKQMRPYWKVSWQVFAQPCTIHGICGMNSLCTYSHDSAGRECNCLQSYKMRNATDWSYGCEPDFKLPCSNDRSKVEFLQVQHVEFFGYDITWYPNTTLAQCKEKCLDLKCDCKGFQFKVDQGTKGSCYPKTLLFNGYRAPSFKDSVYIKLPKSLHNSYEERPIEKLQCEARIHEVLLDRTYTRKEQHGWLKSFIWFTSALGIFEIICFLSYLIITIRHSNAASQQVYIPVVTRFKKFTYAELKKATSNFREEIGQGSGGVVYKGKLSDDRIAAIKCLKEANQGEAEFLAEVSTIGKLNHMNLIEIWGYCAEGKHRLLVYEYMEHGSLADNLHANNLDWQKRFEIALGTAKGLAYLHEECLEWVLHCDVKPQNILLDSNYEPKVSDFGLSKLLNRGGLENSSFSTIRGTRGYMAPEWIFHNPITSKVDVYSYGIVLLELITGKSPNRAQYNNMDNDEMQHTMLVTWVREKIHGLVDQPSASQIQEVVDPALDGNYNLEKMKTLMKVAMKCSEEDKDARPTMSQVVDMLQE